MTERAGSLRVRLALAFVAVAVAALAALSLVILATTRSETSRLSRDERSDAARDVAAELAREYGSAGSWDALDPSDALAAAARADAVLTVRDQGGELVVDSRPGRGAGRGTGETGASVTAPVSVAGRRVGTAELRFRGALGEAESRLRSRLGEAVLLGAGIAVLLALVTAALVAGRVGRPVGRMTAAARRLESGDLSARAAQAGAPGELGELARAFDAMADSLDRQERSRRRLVADLAHELRTPITILRGNLEELIDGVGEPSPQRLASLHEEVLRLAALVEQLEMLGRAEAPVLQLDRAPVDVAALTASELDALEPQLAAKGLALERELEPVVLSADRAKLGQVIANLLSNALKFTPEGGRIAVRVSGADGAARIEVADNGLGITPGEEARVFERFWRGDSAEGVAGHGIGLAVVDEIVRAHGGTVEVAGEPGGGSRFSVSLPLG